MSDRTSFDPQRNSALICFSRIARHHGVDLTITGLLHKYALVVNEEPNFSSLTTMAKESGLKAKAVTLSWNKMFRLGEAFPVLLQLRSGYCMVLSGIKGDPLTGEVALLNVAANEGKFTFLNQQQLSEVWDGRALLIKRSYAITNPSQPFGLRWFIPEILKQKKLFVNVAVVSMIINILALASPIFFQIVVDKVLVHHSYSTLLTLSVGMVAVLLFDGVYNYIKRLLLLYATNKIDVRLAKKTFEHLVKLPIDFFDTTPSGVLIKHMQQTDKIRSFLTGRLFLSLLDATILIVIVPVLFFYNVLLTIIILSFSLLIALSITTVMGPYRRRLKQLYEAEGERQSHLVETIHGIKTVKSLTLEPVLRRSWESKSAMSVMLQFEVGKLGAGVRAVTGFLEKFMFLSVLFIGVSQVFDGSLSVGSLIALNMLAGRVSGPLVQIVSLLQDYQEIGLSVHMLGNVMNRPPERHGMSRGLVPKLHGGLTLENISFRYGEGGLALDDVSLAITPGAVVGIVGRSGSGKTTLTRLIQGLYPVQQGAIRFDNLDIREIELSHLRRNIGVVLQENFLFRGSVRDNICISRPSATFEEIVQAARLAGADEFIQRLPQGYDTVLTENAANLSGGQRQRLAIARALITRPRFLILDEATSALDAESEAIIQANLANIGKGRTMIIVSHRLSMLCNSTTIVVMDNGRIVANAPHEQLLDICDIYRDLWNTQNSHLMHAGTDAIS